MPKPPANQNEQYSETEAQERFEKALHGALNTPPKHLKDIPKKRPESRKKGEKDKC